MTALNAMSGRCLCGAVRFTAVPEKMHMDACHCATCRRWSAGPMMTVSCGASLVIEGEGQLKGFSSSEWAERLFCGTCGTTLFWRMKDGSFTAASAQAFDDPAAFAFTNEIYVDQKPANYAFANDTHKMTGADVVAAFQAIQGT